MKVKELVDQLLDHHPDAEVHFTRDGIVYPTIAQAVEGRVIDPGQGYLVRLNKDKWHEFPAARTVVMLQDRDEERRLALWPPYPGTVD
jgi:hypothetical protein